MPCQPYVIFSVYNDIIIYIMLQVFFYQKKKKKSEKKQRNKANKTKQIDIWFRCHCEQKVVCNTSTIPLTITTMLIILWGCFVVFFLKHDCLYHICMYIHMYVCCVPYCLERKVKCNVYEH